MIGHRGMLALQCLTANVLPGMSQLSPSSSVAAFKSLREYLDALDGAGLLLRIPEFDQDHSPTG